MFVLSVMYGYTTLQGAYRVAKAPHRVPMGCLELVITGLVSTRYFNSDAVILFVFFPVFVACWLGIAFPLWLVMFCTCVFIVLFLSVAVDFCVFSLSLLI